jgi:hypothetical protein
MSASDQNYHKRNLFQRELQGFDKIPNHLSAEIVIQKIFRSLGCFYRNRNTK